MRAGYSYVGETDKRSDLFPPATNVFGFMNCSVIFSTSAAGVDVLVYDGGQERYPLLLAVE